MPGKRKLAGHQPHHWRAIDRNIPYQFASPHCLSPFFPATSNDQSGPEMQNHWTQEPMPRKSTTLDPRIDQPGCVSMPLNSEMNLRTRSSAKRFPTASTSLIPTRPGALLVSVAIQVKDLLHRGIFLRIAVVCETGTWRESKCWRQARPAGN